MREEKRRAPCASVPTERVNPRRVLPQAPARCRDSMTAPRRAREVLRRALHRLQGVQGAAGVDTLKVSLIGSLECGERLAGLGLASKAAARWLTKPRDCLLCQDLRPEGLAPMLSLACYRLPLRFLALASSLFACERRSSFEVFCGWPSVFPRFPASGPPTPVIFLRAQITCSCCSDGSGGADIILSPGSSECRCFEVLRLSVYPGGCCTPSSAVLNCVYLCFSHALIFTRWAGF